MAAALPAVSKKGAWQCIAQPPQMQKTGSGPKSASCLHIHLFAYRFDSALRQIVICLCVAWHRVTKGVHQGSLPEGAFGAPRQITIYRNAEANRYAHFVKLCLQSIRRGGIIFVVSVGGQRNERCILCCTVLFWLLLLFYPEKVIAICAAMPPAGAKH